MKYIISRIKVHISMLIILIFMLVFLSYSAQRTSSKSILASLTLTPTQTDYYGATFTPTYVLETPQDSDQLASPYIEVTIPEPIINPLLTQLAPTLAPSLTPTPILVPPPPQGCYVAPSQFAAATNIRSLPSLEGDVIGRLNYSWYTVIGTGLDSDNQVWYEIVYDPASSAWVASWVVQLSGCSHLLSTPTISDPTPTVTPIYPTLVAFPPVNRNLVGVYTVQSIDNQTDSIFILQNSANKLVLTEDRLSEISYPVLSPDGSLIAYLISVEQGISLKTVDLASGSISTVITSTPDLQIVGGQIAWSADSKVLFFTMETVDSQFGIYGLNVQTGQYTLLIEPGAEPTVSADGEYLALQRNGSIYVTRLDVVQPRPIPGADNLGVCSSPAFDNQNTFILVFSCNTEGIRTFYVYDEALEAVNILTSPSFDSVLLSNPRLLPGGFISFDDGRKVYIGRISEGAVVYDLVPLIADNNSNVSNINWAFVNN